jgi:hypothetical protein
MAKQWTCKPSLPLNNSLVLVIDVLNHNTLLALTRFRFIFLDSTAWVCRHSGIRNQGCKDEMCSSRNWIPKSALLVTHHGL